MCSRRRVYLERGRVRGFARIKYRPKTSSSRLHRAPVSLLSLGIPSIPHHFVNSKNASPDLSPIAGGYRNGDGGRLSNHPIANAAHGRFEALYIRYKVTRLSVANEVR